MKSNNQETSHTNSNDESNQSTMHEQIGNYIKDASESVTEATKQVKEKVTDYSDKFSECVKEAPLKSVLIAAGIGLLVGSILAKV